MFLIQKPLEVVDRHFVCIFILSIVLSICLHSIIGQMNVFVEISKVKGPARSAEIAVSIEIALH